MIDFSALRPLTADLPPIVILSSLDSGGAGNAALRVHQGLVAAGANVKMVVIRKQSGDATVGELSANGAPLWNHAAAAWAQALQDYPARPAGLEMFSTVAAPINVADLELVKNAALVNLHWCSGMLPWPEAGVSLRGKPIVWTLRDMNPFTGGCHYVGDCDKWRQGGCSQCPQLGPSHSGGDLAATNFAAKKDGYNGLDIHVVGISRWIRDCARQSALLGGFPSTVIPNGFPLDELRPLDRDAARDALGLPHGRKIILFGADVCANRRKGLHLLLTALPRLANRWHGELPILATFGAASSMSVMPLGFECRSLGKLQGHAVLALAYSAADIFVMPSMEEALGNVLIEAQACGTPGVGFAIGGVPDIIADSSLGRLAAPFDTNDLADKIHEVLMAPLEDAAAFRKNCRAHAESTYNQYAQTLAYLRLYRRLLGLPEIQPANVSAPAAVPANPAIPAGDYAAPELRYVDADPFFPCKIIGDTNVSHWPWLRREIPHNWYVDCRAPAVGFLSRDEAILLHNAALPFAGENGLEIGCFMGWSACHLALAGLKLDVIDPFLDREVFLGSVTASLTAAGVIDRVNLIAGRSPGMVEQLCANGKRWKFIFIDGDHEAPGPRLDAEVCEKHAPEGALVMFHDVAAPAVADGVRYFRDKGWNVRLYHTTQIMAAAWRGDVPVPRHAPDPRVAWTIPDHLTDLAPLFEPLADGTVVTSSPQTAQTASAVNDATHDENDYGFAPIALFAYNRRDLVEKTVNALKANPEAPQSDLYIFVDGPKPGQEEKVNAVREYLRSVSGFRSVHCTFREHNVGLSTNIPNGITEVINAHGRAIVVEDDILTSPHFLRYMNEALKMYADTPEVVCISGYAFPVKEKMPESYFIRGIGCWGWATWARAWKLFNPNAEALYNAVISRNLSNELDFGGCYPYTSSIKGKSWDILWMASAFLENKLCLFPGRSLVNNIGFGEDASNCLAVSGGDPYQTEVTMDPIQLQRIAPVENPEHRRAIGKFLRWSTIVAAYAYKYERMPGSQVLQTMIECARDGNNYDIVAFFLDKLIQRGDGNLENVYALRGVSRWQLGDRAGGESDIREELRRHPNNPVALDLLHQIESGV